MGRVLGVRCLSHDVDASTSIERQGESIEYWARSHEHTVVALTQDTDASGSIAPQDRDDLGPWLTDRAKLVQLLPPRTASASSTPPSLTGKHARSLGDTTESVMRILDGLHAKRRVLIDAGVRTEARREVRETAELMTDRWLSVQRP
jgi:hypothetical protein